MATVEMVRNAVRTMFQENDWNYDFDKERGIFYTGFSLSNAKLDQVRVLLDVCGPGAAKIPTTSASISSPLADAASGRTRTAWLRWRNI